MQLNIVNITNELYYDALYQSAGSFVFVAPGRAAVQRQIDGELLARREQRRQEGEAHHVIEVDVG